MQLQYEHTIDYSILSRKLLNLSWLTLPVLFVLSTGYAFAYRPQGGLSVGFVWVWTSMLPTLATLLILSAVSILSRFLLRRNLIAAQVYLFLTGLTLISLCLSWFYSHMPVFISLLCLPIFLSVTYAERRIIVFSFAASLAAFAAYVLLCHIFPPPWAHFLSEVYTPPVLFTFAGGIVLILFSFCISYVIYTQQTVLVEGIRQATEKTRRDSLTSLYNHETFYRELDSLILQYGNRKNPFCLIVFDIDDFKNVNDRYGHAVGDEVLLLFVKAITHHTTKKDTAFRYGGEEFAVLTTSTLEGSFVLSCNIRRTFSSMLQKSPLRLKLTASAGICRYDSHIFPTREDFFAAADGALYRAKHAGKDQTIIWTRTVSPLSTLQNSAG